MSVDFSKLLDDPRAVEAPPGSINAELLALPQVREHVWDMRGRLLRFPRTGIIGVPWSYTGGAWSVVVVDGSACTKEDGSEAYPRGGHHISIGDLEMQTAIELNPNTAEEVYS